MIHRPCGRPIAKYLIIVIIDVFQNGKTRSVSHPVAGTFNQLTCSASHPGAGIFNPLHYPCQNFLDITTWRFQEKLNKRAVSTKN
jgi:hypothetical protein